MIPQDLRHLFWDVKTDALGPRAWPEYAIFRVLEYGDRDAVAWMRGLFAENETRGIIRTKRRLTPKSANFWALIYGIPKGEVAALNGGGTSRPASGLNFPPEPPQSVL